MPFHSLRFGVFLGAVWLLHALVPHSTRWAVLLAASLGFFAALGYPALLVALAVVAVVSFAGGWLMSGDHRSAGWRRVVLWTAVVSNVAVLAASKYLPDFGIGTSGTFLLTTVGVSYFTFQGISYLADVYVGTAEVERHFGHFLLYMAFFPKLLQGPIERAAHLLPQFRVVWAPDAEQIRAAVVLFLWGLFKKTVVADRAAPLVDAVYGHAATSSGLSIAVATYVYAIQLYCDFSGYTDMALASGRLFGIQLTQNFANPYRSRSIAEFWRRWHISFARWIQDYLFKPLQFGLRDWGTHGTAAAIMVTFLVSGVWHGAGWTYVIWGALQGLYMAVSVYTQRLRRNVRERLIGGWPAVTAPWQVVATAHLMLLSWVFFRASSVGDAMTLLSRLGPDPDGVLSLLFVDGPWNFAVLAVGALAVVWVDMLTGPRNELLPHRPVARWAVCYALAVAVLVLGVEGRGTFIYFQF